EGHRQRERLDLHSAITVRVEEDVNGEETFGVLDDCEAAVVERVNDVDGYLQYEWFCRFGWGSGQHGHREHQHRHEDRSLCALHGKFLLGRRTARFAFLIGSNSVSLLAFPNTCTGTGRRSEIRTLS